MNHGGTEALSSDEVEILDHTEHRAAGGLYCGGGEAIDALVEAGLMEFAGRKSFVPDAYYRITGKGREVLRAHKESLRKPKPLTRSQRRYREYLNSEAAENFGEWLKLRRWA